jgi:hypothetical protein
MNTAFEVCRSFSQGGEDMLDRKRAAHVMQLLLERASLLPHSETGRSSAPVAPAISGGFGEGRAEWQVWAALHALLEEFGVHLIEPSWAQVGA